MASETNTLLFTNSRSMFIGCNVTVPGGYSVADELYTALHNAAHFYSDQQNPAKGDPACEDTYPRPHAWWPGIVYTSPRRIFPV